MTTTDLASSEGIVTMTENSSGATTRRLDRWTVAILGFIAYVPFLLSSPGEISADTKAYLLLNPGKLLSRAPFMWDAHIDAGTVTHQNIGYLFPLGPWYWTFRTLGVPTWIAERLWFGTLLFAAGAGTLWMLRKLGLRGPGPAVAAFVYMLSPYLLAYMGRTSVILTPWCALPWLIGLMASALRERTWRAPILFALVVTVMAGTNASSVIFVLLGPLLFVPFAIWVTGETDLRSAIRTLIRICITTGPAQLWWLSGLYVQGKFGLPILQLTETVETVAQTSTAPEVLRGLGYWYFYGRDGLAGWTQSGALFTTMLVMLPLSFVLPLFGLLGAILTRWRYRAYFVALILTGLIFAVGTYPYEDPSPIGSIIKFTTSLEVGFALRNSPRIVPLIAIGLAALTATFVDALVPALRRRIPTPTGRRLALALPLGLICVAILNLPPLWRGELVQSDLKFPEELPSYWTDAASWLDAQSADLRVLELPGADFGAYRWGETQDPLTPGLIDRPWIGREITAYGTPASVDLLRALDRTFQEGVAETAAVADVARLYSASDVLLRLDSQFERYRGPRPFDLWTDFGGENPTNGLGSPTTCGSPTLNIPDRRQPMVDELYMAANGGSSATPPLAVYPVDGVRPIVRSETTSRPTVIFGDGAGILEAAVWNRLPRERPLFYAATATASPSLLDGIRSSNPDLVITDTNRKRAQRWGTTRENNGATETAASTPLTKDPKDTRLEMFPDQTTADQSVAWFGNDVADVRATNYGNIVAYSAEVRPANAIDGDLRTAWTTGGFSDVLGDQLVIDYTRPVTADHIDLLQAGGNRWITKVTILLEGQPVTTVDMSDASFEAPGQRVDLGGSRTFSSLGLRIDDANITGLSTWMGFSNVGFREVTVPGVSAQEWIVTPSAGVNELAPTSNQVSYLFSRIRSNPIEGFRQDTELALRRIFHVGAADRFRPVGQARLSAGVNGALIDELLGRPGLSAGFPVVSGDDYLYGALAARPSSAFDGDPSTAWTTRFGGNIGAEATLANPNPITFDRLRLSVVNDLEHSIPTALTLTLDDGSLRTLAIPPIATSDQLGSTTTVEVPTGELTSRVISIAITGEQVTTTKEYFTGRQHILPMAIAEFGFPTTVAPLPTTLPNICRPNLVQIDGADASFTLVGDVRDAIDRRALPLMPCAATVDPAPFSEGEHRLTTSTGLDTGIDVDAINLTTQSSTSVTRDVSTPPTSVTSTGTNSYRVDISGADAPFWLVLGQSLSDGWEAEVRGGPSLGAPILIDGFANGWLIDPAVVGSTFSVDITWAPQKVVWAGLALSTPWFVGLCVAALIVVWRRRRSPREITPVPAPTLVPGEADPGLATGSAAGLVIAIGIVSGFIAGPVVACAMAAITALSVWTRRRTSIATLATIASVGGIVLLYVGLQFRRDYPTGVEWPSGFWIAHQLGLLAVLVVAGESITRWWERTRSKTTQTASDASQMNEGSELTR